MVSQRDETPFTFCREWVKRVRGRSVHREELRRSRIAPVRPRVEPETLLSKYASRPSRKGRYAGADQPFPICPSREFCSELRSYEWNVGKQEVGSPIRSCGLYTALYRQKCRVGEVCA